VDGTVNREVLEQRGAELNRLEEARVAGLLGKYVKTPKSDG
jgi:hypothetical protein